jgi:ATP-binding cassette subfamily C (CFTR/MRP) protein 1
VTVVIVIGLLIRALGYSALVGCVIIFAVLPLQHYVVSILKATTRQLQLFADQRIKLTNELLQGIRVIKFYSWSAPFIAKINEIRSIEMKFVRSSAYTRAKNALVTTVAPILMSLATFIVFFSVNSNNFQASSVFSSVVLFNLLRQPVMFFPRIAGGIADAKTSLKRFDKFLLAPELEQKQHNSAEEGGKYAVELNQAEFNWEIAQKPAELANPTARGGTGRLVGAGNKKKAAERVKASTVEAQAVAEVKEVPSVLRDINVKIAKNSLVAIVGAVGSGKSSLLSGLLGEMKRVKGEAIINGSIAYCPQQAWIQNATIKQNILFGLPYDEEKYRQAIRVCSLEHDLEILPNGENTEIGERGINLSGGQKQRVSLARAFYFSADIILLDDSLSAVDSHVGKHIFHHCINGAMGNKTRILVTHQLQYLNQCDHILFLKDGRIAEQGSFPELMQADSDFTKLMKEFGGQGHRSEEKIQDQDSSTVKSQSTNQVNPAASKQKQGGNSNTGRLITTEKRARGSLDWLIYKFYFSCFGSYWLAVLVFFLMIMQIVANLLTNLWLAYWSDDHYNLDPHGYMGIYAALGVAQSVFALFAVMLLTYAASQAAYHLHNLAFTSLLRAPLSKFFDVTPIGRIMNVFSKDIDIIDNQLSDSFRQVVQLMLQAVGTLIMIVIITPLFVVAMLPIMLLYYRSQLFYRKPRVEIKRLDSVSRSPLFAHFTESLTGLSTIRAYKQQHIFFADNCYYLDAQNRSHFLSMVSQRWIGTRLETMGGLLVFFAALFLVLARDSVPPGLAGLSISYALQVTNTFAMIVRQSVEQENNMNSVERTHFYIEQVEHEDEKEDPKHKDYQPLILVENHRISNNNADNHHNSEIQVNVNSRPSVVKQWPVAGGIEFKEIELRYRPGLPLVLHKVSASIAPGERVGVVGRTGSGKSSLMLALFRLVELSSGQITIDNIDISSLKLHDLRSNLSIIPQDPVLFSGTVRFNLDPFNQYSDAQIWHALEQSHLRAAVEKLELKLESPVSENGENFSVGQSCQMCLARAMLRNANILIIDEGTANIDMETDNLIQNNLRTYFHCTILAIAHRLNTIIDYDRVIVIDGGRIVEFDKPAKLLRNPEGLFSKLCRETGQQNYNLLERIAFEKEKYNNTSDHPTAQFQGSKEQEFSATSQVYFHNFNPAE